MDLLKIERDLASLNLHRVVDEDIDYFYRHMQQLLLDVTLLNNILTQNEALALDETINEMSLLLTNEYLSNQKKEEIIGLLFFAFAFVILLVLINIYLKVLKNRKEVFHLAYHDTFTNLPNRAEFER